jgi:hypothetical protein
VHKRDQAIGTSYAGPFLNAIGIADGERSFWWFADNAASLHRGAPRRNRSGQGLPPDRDPLTPIPVGM